MNDRRGNGLRVLILAPTGRDAQLAETFLRSFGLDAVVCRDATTLRREVDNGCGTLLLAEEAISLRVRQVLSEILVRQPSWSDLPLLVLTGSGASAIH